MSLRRLVQLSLALAASIFGAVPPPAPKCPDPAAVRADGPQLVGDDTAAYVAEVRVTGLAAGDFVFFDITPEAGAEVKESACDNALCFGGPPGVYQVKARGLAGGKKFDLRKQVTLTGKAGPQPRPGPGPDPQPAGAVAFFVVVEDTSKAQAWRGDILGSPVVAAAYHRLQGTSSDPVHRLISVGTDGDGAPAEVHHFVELARGKELPWLFLLDGNRRPVRDLKAPTDPQAFADAIAPLTPHQRAMGNNPPDDGRKRTWKVFGAHPNVPLIPREQWKEVDLGWALPPVKDQDGIGACNAFATITAVEAARKQAGLRYVRLSPGYLYGKINGGRDQGSLLEDALAWMTDHGTVSAATIGELDWRRGRAFNGDAEGQSYRIVEAYECPSFDAMASAIQQGFYIDEGLMWRDNFTPDRDGWLPGSGRGGAGGHALCGYGLARRNGVWGIRTRNSWGAGWGVGGSCVIPESLFGKGVGGFWAVRAVTPTPTAFSARLDPFHCDREFALAP
jgi:hypothetical protein